MAANNHLSEYQFRYRPTGPQTSHHGYDVDSEELEENGHTLYDHSVEAVHKPTRRIVGEMLYQSDGPLFMIDVNQEHQRKGIAEGMLNHANAVAESSKNNPKVYIPKPMRAYHETPDGEAWADSMINKGLLRDNR